ncbi:GNAT family N-acetyltransferase [Erythrobacter arachoides]|uniref:GNAT family N-acetyltransferase n=1 Tax=Aurantiacibacter arachoides TaxID=1850444 RepID=A0A845A706_9SPHN|nr:GNAT family protein [Aurantiacibacter arachoides]MXO94707.1 GNAT family N-acetyltransferase [Aurantiacibacter arachoides]GGD61296.1 hypothetical protein GCM10011411_21960 [Aurantiacibacter arachoides]
MTTGPLLVTERLELWRPVADDLPQLVAMVSHPQTARYLGGPQPMAEHFARFARNAGSWQLYEYGSFMVRLRGGDGRIVGNCGVFHSWRGLGEDFDDRPEAGWILADGYAGQGLAQEALRAVLAWLDGRLDTEIVCMIEPANAPSLRLAGKLGFRPTRDAALPSGQPVRLFARQADGSSAGIGAVGVRPEASAPEVDRLEKIIRHRLTGGIVAR